MNERPRWFRPGLLGLLIVIAAIELAYVFIVSAGTFSHWPTSLDYYNQLAEGFRRGHLYVPNRPPAELVAASNPMDPRYAPLWMPDASLYHGRYYLYWGPLPALLLAAVKTIFWMHDTVGDQYIVFAAFSLSAICGTLIIARMVRRLFAPAPFYLIAAGALAFALGNPVLHMLASTSVYMAAIASGQAFLLLGMVFAVGAVLAELDGIPARGWRLAAAGGGWALALACRITLAPAVLALALLLAHGLAPAARAAAAPGGARRFRLGERARRFVWIAAPVAAVCAALLLYNKLRFDSWTDSGIDKQLSTWHFVYSPHFYLSNIYEYLFRRFSLSCRFPFAIVPYEVPTFRAQPGWIPFQHNYSTPEPLAGILLVMPLAWVIPAAISAAVRKLRARRAPDAPGAAAAAPAPGTDRAFVWLVAASAIMAMVTMAAPAGQYASTMRYLEDARPGLALLGVLGLWTLYDNARASRLPRRLATAAFLAVAAGTVLFGLLLGYQGYREHFERNNPRLSSQLERSLSVCR